MLKTLSIKNIAVIENVNIDFSEGFSILTGETGAGKSIIIDSINLLKGQRANRDIIRTGEQKARVDAVFCIQPDVAALLAGTLGMGIGDEVMLTRELSEDGRSTCRIDGLPVTAAMLKLAGDCLIDIHGQHDNTSLLSKKTHIDFLDGFGGEEIASLKSDYAILHGECLKIERELSSIQTNEKDKEKRQELLKYQINEIEMSNLHIGEDEELEGRKKLLLNSFAVSSASQKAYESLYGGENQSAYDLIWKAIKAIEPISDIDKSLSEAYEALNDAGDIIADKARVIRDYADGVDNAEGEIDSVEERLSEIDDLKHKYAPTIEEILNKKDKLQEELNSLTFGLKRMEELTSLLKETKEKRGALASKLTEARKKYAERLLGKVAEELNDLCMPSVKMEASFTPADMKDNGADDVEFLICTNAGEGLKPLAKIASGGELSRIMLAIKRVIASYGSEKLLIFDEVDTGVSGKAAQSIAEKLWKTARHSQVICITHLPQIASMADVHYLIKKQTVEGRTKTDVTLLSNEERIEEIARTLGGADITDAAIKNAKELVRLADKFKGES